MRAKTKVSAFAARVGDLRVGDGCRRCVTSRRVFNGLEAKP
jgi:hypothetical protein